MRTLTTLLIASGLLAAQAPNPTQQAATVQPGATETPLFKMTVVGRTTKAVNYRHRGGATKIDFRGTPLLSEARGEAKVESKQGYIEIEVEFDELQAASRFGPEFLTYVMWAITPEGRATNLGEVILNGNRSKLNVTTELQAFGLVVTAEPYFAVMQPSDVVVLENVIRPDTRGKVELVDAKYELLQRGTYTATANPADLKPIPLDKKTPLELYQARNAIRIARWANADRYAGETFQKADRLLEQAESYQARKAGKKPVIMTSREAIQTAEDARAIGLRRMEEERLAQERQAAAEREQRAKLDAEESARRQSQAEEQQRLEAERRVRAEADQAAAEQAKREADLAAQRAAEEARIAGQAKTEAQAAQAQAQTAQAQAEAAQAAALAQQQALAAEADKARLAAQEANWMREQAENEKTRLRQELRDQFSRVLETRDSARGLIVNMSDVLFDFNKYTLQPGAREKLAKIAGISLAHPGLKFEIEGHTDSVGSDAYNQTLSERRAQAVRDYLAQQGLSSLTARGFGKSQPVASNDSAAGRQQNRRVELVVSGEIIGAEIPTSESSATTVPRQN